MTNTRGIWGGGGERERERERERAHINIHGRSRRVKSDSSRQISVSFLISGDLLSVIQVKPSWLTRH